jgi:hypothetical protein
MLAKKKNLFDDDSEFSDDDEPAQNLNAGSNDDKANDQLFKGEPE